MKFLNYKQTHKNWEAVTLAFRSKKYDTTTPRIRQMGEYLSSKGVEKNWK